jgi:nicotinamide riboside kinase
MAPVDRVTSPRTPLVVAVVGAESAGKTTLATALASRLGAALVPEIAREYLTGRSSYDADDLREIARRQQRTERRLTARHGRVVVADTDLVVVKVWWETRFGVLDEAIARALAEDVAKGNRRYLLARPDIPWEPDPLRVNPLDRDVLHARYVAALEALDVEFEELTGSPAARLDAAAHAVGRWLANQAR